MLLVSCKDSSYLKTRVVEKVNGIKYGKSDSAYVKMNDSLPQIFDNGAAIAQVVDGKLKITFHQPDTIDKTVITSTYENKSVKKKLLRNEKDSIDKSANVAIKAISADLVKSKLLIRATKPPFMISLLSVLKELKWIVLGVVVAELAYHIERKWLH